MGGGVAKLTASTENPSSSAEAQNHELTPEQAEATLRTLETRFGKNTYLHEGVQWAGVETSLKASPEALWSIAQMEAQGHEPDVYDDNKDDKGEFYRIGTCCKEAPESAKNCVYDKKAADWLRINRPNETFNGSAAEMVEVMGIDIMDPNEWGNILQKNGKFDRRTRVWLKTDENTREAGLAFRGDRYNDCMDVYRNCVCSHRGNGAFRGSLKVKKVSV